MSDKTNFNLQKASQKVKIILFTILFIYKLQQKIQFYLRHTNEQT